MENSTNDSVVKTGDWVITFLITSIPFVGLVMLFIWAFGGGAIKSKSNWAKAVLIWGAIIFAIWMLIALVFGAALFSFLG